MRVKSSFRFEFKYLLNREQQAQMIEEISHMMVPDAHYPGKPYLVTSLYFDTADYRAYWDKLDGHRLRRKIRVRVYDSPTVTLDTPCFAEIKQHVGKTISKKRVILPYQAAEALCGSGEDVETESETDRAVIEEIEYLYYMLQLRPSSVISYNRLAFEGSDYDPGLRVTFDTNLKSRLHDLSLLSQGYAEDRFFLPPEQCVMEVKVNYRTPSWLIRLIGKHHCSLRSVSKYCAALERSKAVLRQQQVTYLKEEKDYGRDYSSI